MLTTTLMQLSLPLPPQWCVADFGGVRTPNATALMLVRRAQLTDLLAAAQS